MTDYADLSLRFISLLKLSTAPVAITFAETSSAANNTPPPKVAAGCAYWEIGAARTVTTSAINHQLCSIGIHTHNLTDAPASQSAELGATLAAMQGLDYVREEEVASLPVMEKPSQTVTYSPLADITQPPNVVVVFADAAQGLLISEVISRVDGAQPLAMGRPACALIPQVIRSGASAASLGCCGARAYLDVLDDNITVWSLLGERLAEYADALEKFATANDVLTKFHTQRRHDVEAGRNPSVEESLQRLSQ